MVIVYGYGFDGYKSGTTNKLYLCQIKCNKLVLRIHSVGIVSERMWHHLIHLLFLNSNIIYYVFNAVINNNNNNTTYIISFTVAIM